MKLALALLALLVLTALAALAYVRLVPSDRAAWHVIPADGPDGLTRTEDGAFWRNSYDTDPDILWAQMTLVAKGWDRTRSLALDPRSRRATFITRSKWMGFPDYASLIVTPTPDGGARLVIWSRLRFGTSDMGVNGDKLAAWADHLAKRLSAD